MIPVNFKTLVIPSSPNTYLVCPLDYCQKTPDEIAPIYSIPVKALQQAWFTAINNEPRTQLIKSFPDSMQYCFVQRSLIFHFPDFIDVQFIALNDEQSTLAIYSRAKYGYSDFGVNKKRVKHWLMLLSKQLNDK